MSKLIYLDNAATTKTAPEVLEAMLPYFTEQYGNPSAIYSFASHNKDVVAEQRERIANALGAKSNEIYFTAGGSESDNWALKATAEAYQNKGKHIITTKIEHHAILHTAAYLEERGFEVTYLDVDEYGKVNPADVEALLACKAAGTDMTVDALLKEKILTIGENIKIRRFQRYEGTVVSYIHGGGRIGVLVKVETSPEVIMSLTKQKRRI